LLLRCPWLGYSSRSVFKTVDITCSIL
jgi:hypothetical protein